MSNRKERGEEIRGAIEVFTKALVNQPSEVRVTMQEGESIAFKVQVAPEDIGRFLGKRGVHAEAIRRLLHGISGNYRCRHLLEVVEEPRKGQPQPP